MGYRQNACKPVGFQGRKFIDHMNRDHASLSAWGFSHLELDPKYKALDIGCGGGYNVNKLVEKCKDGRVMGIDYSKVSVSKSKKFNKENIKAGKCDIIQANVMDLPFVDEEFNVVTAFETIYFWPDLLTAFTEIFRVLKKDGIFMICNEADGTNPEQEKWTDEITGMAIYNESQIRELLTKVGFTDIKVDNKKENNWLDVIAKKD